MDRRTRINNVTAHTGTTLDDFLRTGGTDPELAGVLDQAAAAGSAIAAELRTAGLAGILGSAGRTNIQGESVKKLDLLANQILVEAFRKGGSVSLVASEEMADPMSIPSGGSLAVLFDPLDGSSNVDTGGCVGSIFSVRRIRAASGGGPAALLGRGSGQLAAGYLNYGPATLLVFTTGAASHLFTFHPDRREFLLTNREVRIPERGKVYATNEGQRSYWHPGTRSFVEHLQDPGAQRGKPYSTRYSGCLVTDVHRILLEGGIYLYPADTRDPRRPHGKLRLMYECAPLAMIVEAAGGRASTGRQPIREVEPADLHQRVPLYIGSREEVEEADAFEAGRR